jgi:hypothetical protein
MIIGLLFLSATVAVCVALSSFKRFPLTIIFLALGYVGAAVYYGYLLGFDSQTQLTCPLCPHILGRGAPLKKFILYTFISGTVNAICAIALGWLLVGLVRFAKRKRKDGRSPAGGTPSETN